MSKSRIMGAASSGYNYGANKNSPGNGNGKWQGLWPSVGHARNARLINTRAGGDNRNVVFCMNQLGGVGKISNMFATTADGASCHTTTACHLPPHVSEALSILKAYASTQNKNLCLIGVSEKFKKDTGLNNDSFKRLTANDFSKSEQIDAMNTINNLKLRFRVTSRHSDVEDHVCALIDDAGAKILKEKNYGIPTLCDNIIAYGDAGIVSGEYNAEKEHLEIYVDIPEEGIKDWIFKQGDRVMIVDWKEFPGSDKNNNNTTIFDFGGDDDFTFKTYATDANGDYTVEIKERTGFMLADSFKYKSSGESQEGGSGGPSAIISVLDLIYSQGIWHAAVYRGLPDYAYPNDAEALTRGKFMFIIPLSNIKPVVDGKEESNSLWWPLLRVRYHDKDDNLVTCLPFSTY